MNRTLKTAVLAGVGFLFGFAAMKFVAYQARSAETKPPGPAPAGMVWIPGGEFTMGSIEPAPMRNETPAHTVRVDLWYGAGRLRVTCTDDGRGGASAGGADAVPGRGRGSGLAGIERRIGTFDGIMAVRSPIGGPTEITLEIPCASSSAKTSTS